MAQVIVRYCDQHILNDEEVRAAPWAISLKPPDAKLQSFDADLCPDCSKPLYELVEHLMDIARQNKAPKMFKASPTRSGEGPFVGEGPFACPLNCGNGPYKNGSSFRAHVRQVHGMTAEQFRVYLKEHSLVEPPLDPADPERTCPSCGRVSTTKSALHSHVRDAHGVTLGELKGEPLNYPCPDCERKFSSGTGLSGHRRAAHGLNTDGTPAKPFGGRTS